MIKSTIKLRDYQQKIVDQIIKDDHKEGQIVMSTGAGKTIVAIELIARLGLTAIIIVPNTVLLDQWASEIEKWLNYKPGIIGKGKKEIKDITVATFQSLQSDDLLLQKLALYMSVVFVDELQGAVTDIKIKVLEKFKPKYLFGTTATNIREDGKTPVCGFIFGNNLCNYELISMAPVVEVVKITEKIPVDDYHRIIDELIKNDNRNVLITGIGVGESVSGRKVLVLTKRREHARILYEKYPIEWREKAVFLIDSDYKGRNDLLKSFKTLKRDFMVIIGTTALLSVGMDIPALNTLILACDMKSTVLTTQSCGRVLRWFEGKEDPKIIDICDNGNPILWRQFRARLNFYKEKKWTVTGI